MKNLRVKSVRIVGVLPSFPFQRAKTFVLALHRSMPSKFPLPQIEGLLELEWFERLTEWRRVYGADFWRLKRPVAVFLDNKFIGSDIELLKLTSIENIFVEFVPSKNSLTMKTAFKMDYLAHLRATKRIHCYFDICVDDAFIGTLVFQLYSDILPNTCENFTNLCLGKKGSFLSYKGSKIHRIVKNGWLQGGRIQYGADVRFMKCYNPLEDECYGISHDRRGVLSMMNDRNDYTSEFVITFGPNTWMDNQYVAFGQVIEGVNVLIELEKLNTFQERPLKIIAVKNCGKLNLEELDEGNVPCKPDMTYAKVKKKPKIECIADQVERLIMEAVTACLAMKEHVPDVIHDGDVPSMMNLNMFFHGFYSIPEEVLEDSAKYIRAHRREFLRDFRPVAMEIVEVITYDILAAVLTKFECNINLDDVRETLTHPVYNKLVNGIDMKMEMIEKPYVKKFVDQLARTAEIMLKTVITKLTWMKRSSVKAENFEKQMNEWLQSFTLQETFADDNFRITERREPYEITLLKSPSGMEENVPKKRKKSKKEMEEDPCAGEKEKTKEMKRFGNESTTMRTCCDRYASSKDDPLFNKYFSTCIYDLKTNKRDRGGKSSILSLIENGRYQLKLLRHHEDRYKTKARICLEKQINRWMKGVEYTSETDWIRQTVFSKDDVCFSHTEEIMYGAMTIGLLEIYFLMESYLKQPRRKKYITRIVYSESETSHSEDGKDASSTTSKKGVPSDGESSRDKKYTGRRSIERRDTERRDTERRGTERRGTERRDTERRGTERRGTERRDTERRGTERRGTERRGTERRGTERRDIERRSNESRSIERSTSGEEPVKRSGGVVRKRCKCGDICCDCSSESGEEGEEIVVASSSSSLQQTEEPLDMEEQDEEEEEQKEQEEEEEQKEQEGEEEQKEQEEEEEQKEQEEEEEQKEQEEEEEQKEEEEEEEQKEQEEEEEEQKEQEEKEQEEEEEENESSSSCTSVSEEVDVDEILTKVMGKSDERVNIKSFKWMQNYIEEEGCEFKTRFVQKVHNWLENEIFLYEGFLSKHSLVTKASLLSFSLSIASLITEENKLKSELKDFIYDLWELYFKEMINEALLKDPPKSKIFAGDASEAVEIETEDEADANAISKEKYPVKKEFNFDEFCKQFEPQSGKGSAIGLVDDEITDDKSQVGEIIPSSITNIAIEPDNMDGKSVEIKEEDIKEEAVNKIDNDEDEEENVIKEELNAMVNAEEPAFKEDVKNVTKEELNAEGNAEEPEFTEDVKNISKEELNAEVKAEEPEFKEDVKNAKKAPKMRVIRELVPSSTEFRVTSPYTLPFWVYFLAEITKKALGLIAKSGHLPRRLFYNANSQTSFEDKLKGWMEFNHFSGPDIANKDIRDFIATHHVELENLDTTARSFLEKHRITQLMEKSSRSRAASNMADELILDMNAKMLENYAGEAYNVPVEVLQDLISAVTIQETQISEDEELGEMLDTDKADTESLTE